jgi:hypothetical protein
MWLDARRQSQAVEICVDSARILEQLRRRSEDHWERFG